MKNEAYLMSEKERIAFSKGFLLGVQNTETQNSLPWAWKTYKEFSLKSHPIKGLTQLLWPFERLLGFPIRRNK